MRAALAGLAAFALAGYLLATLCWALGLEQARPDLLALGVVYAGALRGRWTAFALSLLTAGVVVTLTAAPASLVVLAAMLLLAAARLVSRRLLLRHPAHLALFAAALCVPLAGALEFAATLRAPSTAADWTIWLPRGLWSALGTAAAGLPLFALLRRLDERLTADPNRLQYLR